MGINCCLRVLTVLAVTVLLTGMTSPAHADDVLAWNAVTRRTVVAGSTPPPLAPRAMAIVHVAMFDALNGIDRHFTPISVDTVAPRRASRRAAVAQAAYTALVTLYPAQAPALGADLQNSLAQIAAEATIDETPRAMQRGRVWGEFVAQQVLEWRRTDGHDAPAPAYLGSLATGKWRPTPPALLPGLLPRLGTTRTFVIPTSSTFRPAGPPPLTSAEYAADVNEVQRVGGLTSAARTADQTEAARFWAGTALTFWNRAAEAAARQRGTTLIENARLFALLNVAMADAAITCWESKA